MAALAKMNPPLARRMGELNFPPNVRIAVSEAGPPYATVDGIRLHSAFDPVAEAKALTGRKMPGDAEGILISGFALGYVAAEVAKGLKKSQCLFLVEGSESVFRAALESVDLAGLFGRGNTAVFVGNEWDKFLGWIKSVLDRTEVHSFAALSHPPSVRLDPKFYTHVVTELDVAVNRRRVEMMTLVAKCRQFDENAAMNTVLLPECGGILPFKGAFAGTPGIVVAAGPSLENNVDALQAVMNDAIIVTVGKSLRLLLERGIVPHFTASLDLLPESVKVFQGISIPPYVTLVFDHDSHYSVPRAFGGPKLLYETGIPAMRWIRNTMTNELGILPKGLSVAHTAFFFARYLGCDPIILVGVDLAFAGEKTHAEGTTHTWGGSTEKIREGGMDVPSVTGGRVKTVMGFLSFITAFETEIARTKATVINTSHNGARIRGTRCQPLLEAMNGKTVPFDPWPWIKAKTYPPAGVTHEKVDSEAAKLEKFMRDMVEWCDEGDRAVADLKRMEAEDRESKAEAERIKKEAAAKARDLQKRPALTPINKRMHGAVEKKRFKDLKKVERAANRKLARLRMLVEANKGKRKAAAKAIIEIRDRIADAPEAFYLKRILSPSALILKNARQEMEDMKKGLELFKMETDYQTVFFEGHRSCARYWLGLLARMRAAIKESRPNSGT